MEASSSVFWRAEGLTFITVSRFLIQQIVHSFDLQMFLFLFSGPLGTKGEKGDRGDTGEKGDRGVMGPKGESGLDQSARGAARGEKVRNDANLFPFL